MSDEVTGVVRDLLLVAGPIVSAWMVSRMDRAREDVRYQRERSTQIADVRRARLEELYQAIEHQRKALASLMVGSFQIAGGLGAPKDVVRFDDSKIAMLVGIYLPSSRPGLEALTEKERDHAKAMLDLAQAPKDLQRLKVAHDAASAVQSAAAALQIVIADAAAGTL